MQGVTLVGELWSKLRTLLWAFMRAPAGFLLPVEEVVIQVGELGGTLRPLLRALVRVSVWLQPLGGGIQVSEGLLSHVEGLGSLEA